MGALALILSTGLGSPAVGSAAPAGWSLGGKPYDARSQVEADKKNAKRECGANSVLLFRIRGSGEIADNPRKPDLLRRWSSDASAVLIRNGWNVRQMSALYSAPNVPGKSLGDLAWAVSTKKDVISAAKVALAFKQYRDVVGKESPGVRQQLSDAAKRCSKRQILVAGYSLGNIVLREMFNALPRDVRSQVVSVDLVADPTADQRVDNDLDHKPVGAPLHARLTGAGVDTALNALRPSFRQRAYNRSRTGRPALRVTQYCVPYDLVCDLNPVNVAGWGRGVKVHSSYASGGIGERSAKELGNAPGFVSSPPGAAGEEHSPTVPVTPNVGPPPSAPVPAPTTPRTWPAQQGSRGVNTFLNPYNASGMGARIAPYQWVEVYCKVHAPQIVSANPDGYWYRIASPPWNGSYYSPANTFWNGDVPGRTPYTHNTDFSIPDC